MVTAVLVETVEDPVALHRQVTHSLGLEVELLVVPVPLRDGDARRDDRHHHLLLALEVGEQHVGQSVDRVSSPRVGVAVGQVPRLPERRSIAGVMVPWSASIARPARRRRVASYDEGVEARVLAGVVVVQELHQPEQVLGERGTTAGSAASGGTEQHPDADEVAAQGRVDDAHHLGVGRVVGTELCRFWLVMLSPRGCGRAAGTRCRGQPLLGTALAPAGQLDQQEVDLRAPDRLEAVGQLWFGAAAKDQFHAVTEAIELALAELRRASRRAPCHRAACPSVRCSAATRAYRSETRRADFIRRV